MFLCQGELRLAKVMEPDGESNAPAGVPIPWWHHVDCFIENRASLEIESTVTAESFSGFTKLNKEDKDLLKSKLGSGGGKKAGKGSKRKAQAVDEVDAKRKKTTEEDKIEKQLKVCILWVVMVLTIRLFPSCLLLLCQNKSLCGTIHLSSTYM